MAPSGSRSYHKTSALRRRERFPLDDLPVNVLAIALSKTSPRDVCRLAVVSKSFAEAASSDLVWKAFLPVDIEEVIQEIQGGAPSYQRVKDLYNYLTNHLLLGDGTRGYFIDRDTGGVCRTVSARTLSIAHGDNPRYWDWFPCDGSRFQDVAYLKFVCWLELWGEIKCRLPPGMYTLSWVIKFDRRSTNHAWGWDAPITFTATDGTNVCDKVVHPAPGRLIQYLLGAPSRRKRSRRQIHGEGEGSILDQWLERQGRDYDEWWEFNVGDFSVISTNEADSLGEMHVKFAMKEIVGLHGLSGLYVDGLIIRPRVRGGN